MRLASAIVMLWAGPVLAADLTTPPPLRETPVSQQRFFRDIYDNWNNVEITDSNPNGSILGQKGDIIFYNNSGTYKLCVNTSDGGGTTWVCSSAYSTP